MDRNLILPQNIRHFGGTGYLYPKTNLFGRLKMGRKGETRHYLSAHDFTERPCGLLSFKCSYSDNNTMHSFIILCIYKILSCTSSQWS